MNVVLGATGPRRHLSDNFFRFSHGPPGSDRRRQGGLVRDSADQRRRVSSRQLFAPSASAQVSLTHKQHHGKSKFDNKFYFSKIHLRKGFKIIRLVLILKSQY